MKSGDGASIRAVSASPLYGVVVWMKHARCEYPENCDGCSKSNEETAHDRHYLLAGHRVIRVGVNVYDGAIVIEFEGVRILLLDQCRFRVTDLRIH